MLQDYGAVDFGSFPRDLVLSKFRILGCKIDGVTFLGLWISTLIISTSILLMAKKEAKQVGYGRCPKKEAKIPIINYEELMV